ncbi:flagellar hook-associated protein FlgL [Brevibacillus laterosporus]|uniref:Flagellar hook-associated protein FlgL n=1 Tax=Brevibacillus laterosporus TaxID=1465 RepID=A0AAP3DDY4_BRELA|nr:flagellar hook-associated protein FlgL [Brevibacillus laterosporus]MCR8978199.1 flagellar hook-associated protein FlgL [Brevibacillus laterosporus]MCZ0805355.1 flagellar hook-associated protein FlgL [Brevibacillus laterosporus]MCZ0824077.1 flagellar hook-associated protein FlgL [Brevibacillus laterosporus]MCZ0848979.1 flagellar hook-associated protein FlgL [Brevibacillus laterosporus]
MAIRITQNMMNNTMVRNINNSMGRMSKSYQQLSTGKLVSRPSDDPVIASRGMYYRTSLVENEQFLRNAGQAQTWMDSYDTSMDEVGKVFHRVRELLNGSGNGTYSKEEEKSIAAEIDELKKHLGDLANQTVNGKYIYGGDNNNKPPFEIKNQGGKDEFIFTSNEGKVEMEMSQGVFFQVNISGKNIFDSPAGENIFKTLEDIVGDLNAGKSAADYLDRMDNHINNLLLERAALGARSNRLELMTDRLDTDSVSITSMMSKNEDADEAEVITNLKMQENVHRAALGAGARIIQPSLLDFLR